MAQVTKIKNSNKVILLFTLLIVYLTLNIEDCFSQVWAPFGNGINGTVSAFTVYNNELIIGGSFSTAGGVTVNGIVKWNGSTWVALGSGMSGTYPYVRALAVYNGDLIAAGEFTTAGGVSANRIAKWNGTNWSALGSGMTMGALQAVYALMVYNGELIAGGSFWYAGGVSVQNIAKWNGSSWSALGISFDGSGVYRLTIFNGELVAGGGFSTPFSRIAKWNGSVWSGLGSGTYGGSVNSLGVYNNELIAGGSFNIIGGVSAVNIGKWNGTSWSPLGSGLNGIPQAFDVYNNELIAGGSFTTSGGINANRIAKWNGTNWAVMSSGMDNTVNSLIAYNSVLIAGGSFTTAGGINANYIAQWGNNITIHDIITGPFFDLQGQTSINTQVPVKVKILNNGTVNEPVVPVKFFINGTLVNTTNKNLNPGQTDSVINTWTPTSAGIYNLMYVSSLPQDTNRYNDTVKTVITVLNNMTSYCIGTDAISANFPFLTYYKNGRTKILYLASELNAAGLGPNKNIANIGFDVISFSPQVMNGFTVKMKHTSNSSVNWNDSLDFTTMYSGSYAVTGTGLQYINFPQPYFVYNGTSNLIIEICFSNTIYTQCTYVKSTNVSGGMTRREYSDNLQGCSLGSLYSPPNNRPNICFTTTTLTNSGSNFNTLPEKFTLSQNYPNPFNPTTNIKYQIADNSFVTLKIFDVIGREVKTLVNETKTPGSYSVDFNASDLSSGVYFYKIQAGDFSETKKMMLIK